MCDTEETRATKGIDNKVKNESNSVGNAMKVSSIEKGHRLGNFHNYYAFHPPNFRLDELATENVYSYALDHFINRDSSYDQDHEIKNTLGPSMKKRKVESKETTIDKNAGKIFRYCDLGCNEGDMTIGVAERILSLFAEKEKTMGAPLPLLIRCLGLDIDEELIKRANEKASSSESESLETKFQTCNLCDANDHESKYSSFLSLQENGDSKFDLTTIFSTTMWIHVHAGDVGLKAFIKRACESSEMILIEPQSSKR